MLKPKLKSQNFLSSSGFDFKDKVVLLRIDADVDLKKQGGKLVVDEDFRLKSSLPTIHFLESAGAKKIIILSHLGRPDGKHVSELSLKPITDWFKTNNEEVEVLENLRFDSREEANDPKFAKKLASLGDVFVNDAFGASHRDHVSIVGLPKLLPSFLGLRFEAEIKMLTYLLKRAKRPLVFVLGGSKKDKLSYLDFLADWADKLLIGGKLPLLIQNLKLATRNPKFIIAELNNNQKDINDKTIKEFKKVINQAATIIWAGPMGVYEEEENRQGTTEIIKAIVNSSAGWRIAGGGDTHRVLSWVNLWQKFDFVSVGGGAMLQFLKDKNLPGIKAI